MRAYTHGVWAHRQRVSTTFLTRKYAHKCFLCSWRGRGLNSGSLDLEFNALPIEPPRPPLTHWTPGEAQVLPEERCQTNKYTLYGAGLMGFLLCSVQFILVSVAYILLKIEMHILLALEERNWNCNGHIMYIIAGLLHSFSVDIREYMIIHAYSVKVMLKN